jgi:hypothetical protein
MGADKEAGMSICQDTGLSIPECACSHCIERQLEQFAPEMVSIRRTHDPLLLGEARSSASPLAPVSERLRRPAL